MCYTIYLYHYFIISLVGYLLLPKIVGDSFAASVILNATILAPVIVVSSAILFAVTERPFMKRDWPGRVRSTLSRIATTTSPAARAP